ncbi:siderophore-interacting protein [Dietzia sp. ANT_WB102]|uniref:siderophore-interacting protein n=1 Tax=Dietzia sp. ANT_WB102 TaxID=2597345 RepID=UPI0011EBB6CC|nr:siderophore-interacting protein [Dietzia sp. ANT_WB102]KAA0918324.1 siderophore-interacting protein [Dietzia sp. ANT_WB102]
MHGEVRTTERLTPSLIRIVLGGPGLNNFVMPDDDTDAYVNLAVPPRGATYGPVFDPREVRETHPREHWPARRRCTVRRWNAAARELTLDFVVHGGSGAAGAWALAAQPGDVLVFNGPGSGYHPDPTVEWHFMAGDESALPAIAASLEKVPAHARVVVRLVCDGPEHELPLESPGRLDLRWVHRTEADPAPLLAAVEAASFPGEGVQAFIHGEAEETRALRRHVIRERGVSRETMSCSPYWRRGMSDEQWRSVKRDFVAAMNSEA